MQTLVILHAYIQLWCVADSGKISDHKRCATENLLYKFIPIHIHIENHTQSWKQNNLTQVHHKEKCDDVSRKH